MTNIPGFYGKFPELGDFVNRRLPQDFVAPWDNWLQNAVSASRAQMGDTWLSSYLTSPVWRFVISRDLCGEFPWCGLVMPSVDRVGRYFPLTLACRLPPDANLISIVSLGSDWFELGEQTILSALNDGLDMDAFDIKVAELGNLDEVSRHLSVGADAGFGHAWQLPMQEADGTADFSHLTHQLLIQRLGEYSLWWGSGSENLSPSLLVCGGLPQDQDYASMLDGNWDSGTWDQWSLNTDSADSGESGF